MDTPIKMKGKPVELLGKTKRLKQLRKEFGAKWLIAGELSKMQCFNGELGCSIVSLNKEHIRNVRTTEIISWRGEE